MPSASPTSTSATPARLSSSARHLSPCGVVLVLEDEPDIALQLVDLLQADGHACFSASRVDAALRASLTRDPDVIVSDFNLPDGTAADLLRELARRPAPPPVILQSAAADTLLDRFRDDPLLETILHKPIDPQTLRDAVRACVARRLCRPRGPVRLIEPHEHRALLGEDPLPGHG